MDKKDLEDYKKLKEEASDSIKKMDELAKQVQEIEAKQQRRFNWQGLQPFIISILSIVWVVGGLLLIIWVFAKFGWLK